jgi:hypothetical protein
LFQVGNHILRGAILAFIAGYVAFIAVYEPDYLANDLCNGRRDLQRFSCW